MAGPLFRCNVMHSAWRSGSLYDRVMLRKIRVITTRPGFHLDQICFLPIVDGSTGVNFVQSGRRPYYAWTGRSYVTWTSLSRCSDLKKPAGERGANQQPP